MANSTSRVWRVRGIPLKFDSEQLENSLREHPRLQTPTTQEPSGQPPTEEHNNGVDVLTLAVDYRPGHTVATVRFGRLPASLEGIHTLTIPHASETCSAGQKRRRDTYITLDDKFEGITVLFSPDSTMHHFDVL